MKQATKSATTHAILDAASRKRKAEKIVRVLRQKTDLSKAHVLDIGTGAGYIAQHIAGEAGAVTSIDLVDERLVKDGYAFVQVQNETMPFDDETFDVVISNHVIEHVTDQKQHVKEVLRVLRPGGIAYMATPNKNWLIDPHYRLPFINWMPRPIAATYLKTLKGKTWDIRPVTTRTIQTLAGPDHRVESIVVDIIKKPKEYHLDTLKQLHPLTTRLPPTVLQPLSHISPTILLIVTKAARS